MSGDVIDILCRDQEPVDALLSRTLIVSLTWEHLAMNRSQTIPAGHTHTNAQTRAESNGLRISQGRHTRHDALREANKEIFTMGSVQANAISSRTRVVYR